MCISPRPNYKSESSRWAAVVSRDANSNGIFVYCVKTTRIYCRPICKARLARRANVEFHDNAARAEKAGYRSCKRCKPELDVYDPHSELIAKARLAIDQANPDAKPTLKKLAAGADLSEWHFHRIFKRVTGVTPKAYATRVKSIQPGTEDLTLPPQDSYFLLSEADPPVGSSRSSTIVVSTPTEESCPSPSIVVHVTSDEAPPEQLERPWKSTDPLQNTVVLPSTNYNGSFQSVKEIQYTIQPWGSNFVLIAITRDGICALDSGESKEELLENLQLLFPLSPIYLSDWDGVCNVGESMNFGYEIFATVVSALLSPTGRTLHLSFDSCLQVNANPEVI